MESQSRRKIRDVDYLEGNVPKSEHGNKSSSTTTRSGEESAYSRSRSSKTASEIAVRKILVKTPIRIRKPRSYKDLDK